MRAEAHHKASAKGNFVCFAAVDQCFGLIRRNSQRFFHQNVLSGLRRKRSFPVMLCDRCRNINRINLRIAQQFFLRRIGTFCPMLPAQLFCTFRGAGRQCNQFCVSCFQNSGDRACVAIPPAPITPQRSFSI